VPITDIRIIRKPRLGVEVVLIEKSCRALR
jgi:hypothetical protein